MRNEVKSVFDRAEIPLTGESKLYERISALDDKNNKRALRVIRSLRMRQNRQDAKIDILCRDIVGAHNQFIEKVSTLSVLVEFQQSLLGSGEMNSILENAASFIKKFLSDTATAIFMIEPKGFDIHFSDPSDGAILEKAQFESWFTPVLVQEISRCNQICTLGRLLEMGLQAVPAALKHITAAAIPIGKLGKGVGFIFVYRPVEREFQPNELSMVLSLACPLRVAIQNTQASHLNTLDISTSL